MCRKVRRNGRDVDRPAARQFRRSSPMNATATRPGRRRGGWFADRPIGVKILAMIAFSGLVGVLLCALAVNRIDALDQSQRDLYGGHVVALSDLDAIQATYEEL